MGLYLMVLNDDDSGTACFIHSHGLKEQSQQSTKNHYSIMLLSLLCCQKGPRETKSTKERFYQKRDDVKEKTTKNILTVL